MSPASRGSGTGRSVSTDHMSATSSTLRAIGPTVSSVGTSGKTPSVGIRPHCDFSPTTSQAADGRRIEQPVSEPSASSQRPGGERGRRARRRAARRLARMRRVVARPVPLALAEDAPRELGQVRLADEDGARVEEALDRRRVPLGDVIGVEARAVRRADAGGVEEVLDRERPARRAARARPAPGSTRVMNALHGVGAHGDERDALDLDLRALDGETRHLDERRRRSRRAEDLLAHRVDERPVVDVGEEDRDLHDVLEAAAARLEHGAHVLEHLPRLRDDVVAADEPPVAVDGDDPGDVQEASGEHGVREVRDRLGEPVDADLLAAHALLPFVARSASRAG